MHVTGTVPQSAPAPQETPAAAPAAEDTDGNTGRHARRFGLPVATALVMGNIIGGGIFLLPASVAPYGTVSLLAFGVLTVGAIALALVMGNIIGGGIFLLPASVAPYGTVSLLAFGV
ncbi:hypothetical protein ACWDA7_30895, partial [Streptomyces sp. NPDC001156]